MMPSQLVTTAAIASHGAAAAQEAAIMVSDILAAAERCVDARKGAQLRTILQQIRRSEFSGYRDDPRARARRLAARSGAQLAELSGFSERIERLEKAVMSDIEGLNTALDMEFPEETPWAVESRHALLERRLVHLKGIACNLGRCRLLLAHLVSSEHLAHDQLALLRDVATPVAARDASLENLSREARASQHLGDDIQALCGAMIQSGAAKSKNRR